MWTKVTGGQVERVISSPINITVDNVTHPKSIFTKWTKPELKIIGIYPYREDSIDQRYYNTGTVSYAIGADEVVGSYTSTDKNVAPLKEGMIIQTRSTASGLLARDDWMSIREAEGGTAMPDDIKTYRAAIRTESGTKETEINALSDLDAVKGYEATSYTEVRKEEHTDDDGVVTYGPDTRTSTRHINLVTHYETTDPSADADPTFVSLTKD
jgi:hypothetical protein